MRRSLFVVGALVASCASTKEWEEKPGELALYATPLPPTPGQALVLGVSGENVGPVDVFQGERRIASFANVDLSKRFDVEVVAVSPDIPKAVTVAYDRTRKEVSAVAFPSAPSPEQPGPDAASPGHASEDCPGVEDLSSNMCPAAGDAGTVTVRAINLTDGPISVYASLPDPLGSSACLPQVLALVAAGAEGKFSAAPGTVVRFVDDRSAASVRIVRLPAYAACVLHVPKGS